MEAGKIMRRFLVPRWLVTLYYFAKFRCLVSPRAEVEFSPLLTIGARSRIGSFTKIKASDGPMHIGNYVQISTNCEINSGKGGLRIGDDCMLGACVSVIGNNYSYDRLDIPLRLQGKTSKGIQIANDVWIGSGSRILDGAVIGANVIITPNSVVSGRIPDKVIASGNPAKAIFRRR